MRSEFNLHKPHGYTNLVSHVLVLLVARVPYKMCGGICACLYKHDKYLLFLSRSYIECYQ